MFALSINLNKLKTMSQRRKHILIEKSIHETKHPKQCKIQSLEIGCVLNTSVGW